MTLLTNASVVTGSASVEAHASWLRIDDASGLILEVGNGTPAPHPGEAVLDLGTRPSCPASWTSTSRRRRPHLRDDRCRRGRGGGDVPRGTRARRRRMGSLVTAELDDLERTDQCLVAAGRRRACSPASISRARGSAGSARVRTTRRSCAIPTRPRSNGCSAWPTVASGWSRSRRNCRAVWTSVRLVSESGAIVAVGHTAASYDASSRRWTPARRSPPTSSTA